MKKKTMESQGTVTIPLERYEQLLEYERIINEDFEYFYSDNNYEGWRHVFGKKGVEVIDDIKKDYDDLLEKKKKVDKELTRIRLSNIFQRIFLKVY